MNYIFSKSKQDMALGAVDIVVESRVSFRSTRICINLHFKNHAMTGLVNFKLRCQQPHDQCAQSAA
jgi:hypothetical protein